MSKYRVSEEQYDYVMRGKRYGTSLARLLHEHQISEFREGVLFSMTQEEIAAIWLGVAEVEMEPVEPWEAYKAMWEGKTVFSEDEFGYNKRTYHKKDNPVMRYFYPNEIERYATKFYIKEEEDE